MFCDIVVQGMSCDTWDEFSKTILLRYLSYLYGTLYMDPSASLKISLHSLWGVCLAFQPMPQLAKDLINKSLTFEPYMHVLQCKAT